MSLSRLANPSVILTLNTPKPLPMRATIRHARWPGRCNMRSTHLFFLIGYLILCLKSHSLFNYLPLLTDWLAGWQALRLGSEHLNIWTFDVLVLVVVLLYLEIVFCAFFCCCCCHWRAVEKVRNIMVHLRVL